MNVKLTIMVLCAIAAMAQADLYMHNPRGNNNRLDEQGRNRNNANRLFDSQNNEKGGYNVHKMEYYGGSELQVEWTNQHSCGDKHCECQLIMQYMCEDPTGLGIRNGQSTGDIPEGADGDHRFGRHESAEYYADCKVRQRNLGLFLADQTIAEDASATRTRQDSAGTRYGYECPEERDYYPYWHPTPWKDVAIFTARPEELCPMYRAESQNVKGKGYCAGLRKATPGNDITSGSELNNEAECNAIPEFEWVESEPWKLPAPECRSATDVWSRVNHLGNGLAGWQNSYTWRLPIVAKPQVCVFRMRYNISTTDYDGWNTFGDKNGDETNYAWVEDPTVDVGANGVELNLKLKISPDQMGRTFQDRSSTFIVKPSPVEGRIINLNVMGQRGNIVENYPSVEYDFVPTILRATTSTYIHRQVSGSDTTPAGAGGGQQNTDRSNFVSLNDNNVARNYPAYGVNATQLGFVPSTDAHFDTIAHWATLSQNDDELDDAAPHQDFGLQRYSAAGTHHYMSTRNNDFTNRSHKGTIVVTDSSSDKSKVDAAKIAMIAGGSVAGVVVVGGGAAYVATHRDSFSFGSGGGAKAPAGYA